jgi:hypothetical protein
VRLNFTTPRFIVRYHALQDQITRLHLEQPNVTQAEEETAEEKNEGVFDLSMCRRLVELESLVEHQENEQVNENEPTKLQDHDNLSQNTIQDVVSEAANVDGQYDTQDNSNEESDLQHSTDRDTTKEPTVNHLISLDQDANNLHPTGHQLKTIDLHSRPSEVESYSEDGKIISRDVVEAEWDHDPDDDEVEHFYEDSEHSSKVVSSIHTDNEQELQDMSQSCKFIIQDSAWV